VQYFITRDYLTAEIRVETKLHFCIFAKNAKITGKWADLSDGCNVDYTWGMKHKFE
jgi:hypothetical protein